MPSSYAVTATGSPTPSYTVTSGELPAGLVLGSTTGVIGGTPTTPGTSTSSITVSNGVGPDASTSYTITTAAPVAAAEAEPAETGSSAPTIGALSAGMLLFGAAVMTGSRRRRAVRA